jgi:hypothetical protein
MFPRSELSDIADGELDDREESDFAVVADAVSTSDRCEVSMMNIKFF